MDSLYSARLTVYRAILARFPPGPERERWLQRLERITAIRCSARISAGRFCACVLVDGVRGISVIL
jgi:hypothetical protein